MILETMEDGKDVVLYLRDLTGSGDLIYSTKVLPMPSPCSFFYLHFLFQGRTPPSIQWSYPEAESPHNASPSIASTFTLPPHPAPSIPSLHLHDHPHPPACHHSLPSQMLPQAPGVSLPSGYLTPIHLPTRATHTQFSHIPCPHCPNGTMSLS